LYCSTHANHRWQAVPTTVGRQWPMTPCANNTLTLSCYTASMPLVPPPPYIDDIFMDFSLYSSQHYVVYETRLYQSINFQAKVRLGYGKAISVLQRELGDSSGYKRIIRPYQIDLPDNRPLLSLHATWGKR